MALARRRRHARAILAVAAFVGALLTMTLAAQPADERGIVGIELMLRKLAMAGTVMHVTAHPDDENNALLARQSHGQGLRVILATATRGNGGQNEIGPELFEALGVLRTEELAAAHRFDGAEQMFGRAVDFGYSFSVDETFRKWGRDEILGDYVRLIRMTRPDVLVTMRPDLPGGGQHHQASAILGLEAFDAAGDPARYPEQLAEGLRPWQPAKIYKVGYYGFFRGEPEPPPGARLVPIDGEIYDPLLGRTYQEIGSQARAMHKCQGFGQLLALPGPWVVRYQLAGTSIPGQMEKDETDLTDGLDLSLGGLARFADPAPAALRESLDRIAAAVSAAGASLSADGLTGQVSAALQEGLRETRTLMGRLDALGITPEAAYEIRRRLEQTAAKFEKALLLATAVRIEALADDGVVTAGQEVKVTLLVANRGAGPLGVASIGTAGFAGQPACQPGALPSGGLLRCEMAQRLPPDARPTEPYWTRVPGTERYEFAADAPFGQPFRPTPFRVRVALDLPIADLVVDVPVQFRYQGSIFSGEKRTELLVVPALSVRVSPDIAVVPTGARLPAPSAGGGARPRGLRVTVVNNASGAAGAVASLGLPPGWRADPARATLQFARSDEAATAQFMVHPPAGVAPGAYTVAAHVESGGRTWTRGYDVIEYPHTTRRHIYMPATATIKALDVEVPPGLRVGYVMGVGDQVPQAIAQLGASVQLLDEADLASGDLSGFDAIVTGVRAYERRRDLRAYNHRLLEYARGGGTVLVQYNKFEFNQAQYGPWPVKVSAGRVTDETSPVTVLAPDHPVFTWPNRIDGSAWDGWVQERGLYFLGERDARYSDLVELQDPFPDNAGPRRGALVEARIGEGRWVYIGLGLWRQLPAGTDGAYTLLANLISLGAPRR